MLYSFLEEVDINGRYYVLSVVIVFDCLQMFSDIFIASCIQKHLGFLFFL